MGLTSNDPDGLDTLLGELPVGMREDAEQVVRHLAILRGTGLFVSGVDGRLLLRWLEGGVPVVAILAALETAAERRRKRKVHTALSLKNCSGVLQKILQGGRTERIAPVETLLPSTFSQNEPGDGGLYAPLVAQAVETLSRVCAQRQEGVTLDILSRQAMDIVQRFHEDLWIAALPERPMLLAAAAEELAGLQNSLDEQGWERALEAVARDRLRSRHPMLSAAAVWDRLHAP